MTTLFTASLWRRIAWQASTIEERTTAVAPQQRGLLRTESWTDTNLVGDWAATTPGWTEDDVVQRVARSDMDEFALAAIADVDAFPDDVALPDWVTTAQDVAASITDTHADARPALGKPPGEIPFADVLAPIVAFARDRALEAGLERVPSSVVTSLQGALRQDLVRLCSDVLYVEFRTYIAVNRPSAFADPATPAETDLYDEFIAGLRTENGLAELFAEYPVLPRFLARIVTQWCDAVREFDRRLDADWQSLGDTFNFDYEAVALTEASILDSDRHADGRRVVLLTFDDDTRVVYKPRSVRTEAAFDNFLKRAGDAVGVETRSVDVLAREAYGWVEHVAAEPCSSTDAMDAYYRRAGVVLASAHLLYLNDCHYENVVANGRSPVVVDAETLLTPAVSPSTDEAAPTDAVTGAGSVLWTGLLPQSYSSGSIPETAMVNGFGEPEIPIGSGPVETAWSNVNTNAMRRRERDAELMSPPPRNVPSVEESPDSPVAAAGYADEISETFAAVCRAVVEDRLSLPSRFSTLQTRVLFRNTQEYDGILSALQSPETLQDGRRLTFTTDVLVSEAMLADADDPAWDVVNAERRALLRLDVPRLTADANSGTLHCGDATIDGITESAGYRRVKERFTSLNADTIRKQCDVIEMALNPSASEEAAMSTLSHAASSPDIAVNDLMDAAGRVYDCVVDATVGHDNDAGEWVVRRETDAGRLQVGTAGDGLYEGQLGVAVFAAVVADQLHRDDARETALELTGPLRDAIRTNGAEAVDGLGLDGLGGAIYGLSVVGTVLNASECLAAAKDLVDTFEPDRISEGGPYDVMRGAAGLVLGCLALHEHRPASSALTVAREAGDALVAAATADSGGIAWPTGPTDEHLTGFAHGAAGIAHALGRLTAVTGDPLYRECATQALQFEQQSYSNKRANWPDRRDQGPAFADAWCHGRTGGVLARLALENTPVPVHADVATVADRIGEHGRGVDGLCCGNAGRAVAMAAAGAELDDDRLCDHARSRFGSELDLQCVAGSAALAAHTSRVPNPTLFQGLSGIGFALLYTANPTVVPNVLQCEPA